MLSDLICPLPVPLAASNARELVEFDAVATVLSEVVVNDEDTGASDSTLVPVGDLKNLRCRVYPIESRDRVPTFGTGREYTDKVLLDGFYPRINSSNFIRVTRRNAEQIVYEVLDTEKDGNDERTTLLAKARFDRS